MTNTPIRTKFNGGFGMAQLGFEHYLGEQPAVAPPTGAQTALVWGKFLNDAEAILNGVPLGNENLYILKVGNPYGLPEGTPRTRVI